MVSPRLKDKRNSKGFGKIGNILSLSKERTEISMGKRHGELCIRILETKVQQLPSKLPYLKQQDSSSFQVSGPKDTRDKRLPVVPVVIQNACWPHTVSASQVPVTEFSVLVPWLLPALLTPASPAQGLSSLSYKNLPFWSQFLLVFCS